MTTMDDYRFADLEPEQVSEIRGLEANIRERTGRDVTLIAYAPNEREDGDEPQR